MMHSNSHPTFLSIIFIIGGLLSSINGEICPAAEKQDWTYWRDHSNGPEHWGERHPKCNGHLQSPINIDTNQVLTPDKPQILQLKNFDQPLSEMVIENHGQLFHITPADGVKRFLVVNGEEYPFISIHFHFGNTTNDGGSEHTIDGKRYPMEGHFVFALPNRTIIQVATFFEVNNEINSAMDNILAVKPSFKYAGGKFKGKIFRKNPNPRREGKIYFDDLMDFNCPYYWYMGSNAIPPCIEGAPYLICKTHKYIKYSQLRRLFLIKSVTKDEDVRHDCRMKNNNRPVQDRNNRPVYG